MSEPIHNDHDHKHGPDCEHTGIVHDDHVDYLHDGHLHHQREDGVLRAAAAHATPQRHTPRDRKAVHLAGRLVGAGHDVNVIDHANLQLEAPEMVFDLPAGGRRFMQRARGYERTMVAGIDVIRDDELTGELPGRLIRA